METALRPESRTVDERAITYEATSDERLVLALLERRDEEAAAKHNRKLAEQALEQRLRDRSGWIIEIGDYRAILQEKTTKEVVQRTLFEVGLLLPHDEFVDLVAEKASPGLVKALCERFPHHAEELSSALVEAETKCRVKIKKRKTGR